jgi:class 3 adenylate cyclase/tetratricopeptide (TPR) repeat protein
MCGARLDEQTSPARLLPREALVEPSSSEEQPSIEETIEGSIPSQPVSAQVRLRGERRQATIILADVRRSTDLMEQVGTEIWVEMMNCVFQILEAEIYRYGGVVDQFRGDALVAFFGTTVTHEDDPERAVLAALAMQEAIRVYAAELAESQDIELLLRVGMNTGEVIVANIGDSSQYSEDTAMGGAVALAARLEAAAEPGTVLASEDTYRLIQSRFEWEALGKISVKGISLPVAVYRPLAPRADTQRSLRLETYGLSPLLVGRDEPFKSLKRCVQDLRADRGGIVMLTGEEGMGKSHLVAQVRQQDMRDLALLAKMRGSDDPSQVFATLTWFQGRCRSYEQSRPYAMWLNLLRAWLGVSGGEPQNKVRDCLRCQAEALWGDRLAEYYPYLAAILSLPLIKEYAERIERLDAEGLHQQVLLAVRGWVEALAEHGPLALIFEDVHWVDASSLELLEYCLPLCERRGILWLIMFRLERSSEIRSFYHRVQTDYLHRVVNLTLSPLTETQSSEMLERLIGPRALPPKARALIISKAGGNPYYIEELVHSLIRDGTLAQDEQLGEWHATQTVTSIDLPDTLRGLLLARIDDLTPDERRVLQMAAVIGPIFWSNVLRDLNGDVEALDQRLASLQRAQLIYERGRVPELGVEYGFKSAMMRDAAYEGLLRAERATYHLQVAEYLEYFFGLEMLPRYDDLLAYHYWQAGDANKELFYTLQAAEQAKRIYSNAEALKHYTRALELLDELETLSVDPDRLYAIRTQRFEVLNGRREVFALIGNSEAGQADAQSLLPLAQQLDDDPVWLIDALLQQPGVSSWHWWSKKELAAGVPMAQQALDLSRQLGDRHREMQSLLAITNQRLVLDDPNAWQSAEQALSLAQELGDRQYEVNILVGFGRILVWDQPERSIEYLEAALPISQELDDKLTEMNLLELIGMQFERSGDYHRLLTECHQKRLRISREMGYRAAEAGALMFCGQVQGIYLGDHRGGLRLLEKSKTVREGGPGELFVLLRIVQILVAQDEYDQALKVLERARRVSGQNVPDIGQAGLRIVSAILYNALGEQAHLHKALKLASQARQLVIDGRSLSRQYEVAAQCQAVVAYLGLASCIADETESDTYRQHALESSLAALDMYQSLGGIQVVECVSEEIFFLHSQALAACGRQVQADEVLQQAYDEMMRKHDLIPSDSVFRRTYLENIPLHRDISAAHTVRFAHAGVAGQEPGSS